MQRVRNHLSCDAQYECERVISDLVDAVVRDVADRNTPLARRLYIDVVVANAVADDDLGALHGSDHFGVDRRELCDDCIRIGGESL